MPVELRTERLVLRDWRDADVALFAAMNADPAVMEHFPAVQDRATSDASAARIRAHLAQDGWGFWAVEVPGVAAFCGFVGLQTVPFEAPFAPAVEIGWRLARAQWGHGYATEGARASAAYAFEVLGLREIVSMTVPGNERSQGVMRKLGMTCDPGDDFDHPRMQVGSPVRRHVLYRLARPAG